MTRGDKLLVLLVIASSISSAYLFLSSRPGKTASRRAVISVAGEAVRTVSLARDTPGQLYAVTGKAGVATVEVQGGKIRVKDAQCSRRICVRQGWIDIPGESVVCMPGQVVISIEGAAAVDAVTR